MQAITTTYHGPTDTRGSRITARCDAGRITVPYDHSASDAHDVAAVALLRKLGWDTYGVWVRGGLPNQRGNVYVCLPKHSPEMTTLSL